MRSVIFNGLAAAAGVGGEMDDPLTRSPRTSHTSLAEPADIIYGVGEPEVHIFG